MGGIRFAYLRWMGKAMIMQILKVSRRPDANPTLLKAGRLRVWKGRVKEGFCRFLNKIGIPGAVRDVSVHDPLTGQSVRVHVGTLFTCISVNGRDYYFHRLSGRFDGAGYTCCS
jgi:hypothetical protein